MPMIPQDREKFDQAQLKRKQAVWGDPTAKVLTLDEAKAEQDKLRADLAEQLGVEASQLDTVIICRRGR